MLLRSSKYRKIGLYGLGAVLLISMGVTLRVILIGNRWPLINSDEATLGLQALHILTRGERPLFLYGQNYMGTIQSYLGAFFFRIFGPSIFALRLGLVVLYAGFLLVLYLLASLLYSKGIALATLFFLCWGSSYTLDEQLWAFGGRFETLLFGTLSLLLASWLALSFDPDIDAREQSPEGARRKRLVVYGCLGGVIGLGLWSDVLILPFVLTSVLLLLLFCRSELHNPQIILLGILGFVVGSFPRVLFTIEHPQSNLPDTLWLRYTAGGNPLNFRLAILGTILVTLPAATDANPLCPVSAVPDQWTHQLSLSCMAFQGCWSLGVIIVWALATLVVIKELREHRRILSTSGSPAEREHLVRCACRLMLLASAGLIVLAYVPSANGAIIPLNTKRYLMGLSVATPAIVAFLWPKLSLSKATLTRLITTWPIAKVVNCLKISVFCFISVTLILGMVTTFRLIPETQKRIQRQNTLIQGLLRLHTPHIYSDYWTCYRLIFLSDERIICSVLYPNLNPWWNRYPPYARIVKYDPHSAYVFDIEKYQASSFDIDNYDWAPPTDGIHMTQAFRRRFGTQYHPVYLAGFVIYLPASNTPI